MDLSRLGEFGLIERLARHLPTKPPVKVGIGDDAAVFPFNRQEDGLFTTDMILERTHFRANDDPYWIGWKAIGVNVSDIAAMGGEPTFAVVALGLPRTYRVEAVDRLYAGMRSLAKRFNVQIVGGDTDRARRLTIAVAMLGKVKKGQALLRSGARPGDAILVTGRLGGSILGKHLRFMPRVREAQWLARHARPHAMIDLSDGLSSDLRRICERSHVGAVIEANWVPIAAVARQLTRKRGGDPLDHALHDGEDFELLLSCAPRGITDLCRRFEYRFRLPLTSIGRIQPGRTLKLRQPTGRTQPFPNLAFRHF